MVDFGTRYFLWDMNPYTGERIWSMYTKMTHRGKSLKHLELIHLLNELYDEELNPAWLARLKNKRKL